MNTKKPVIKMFSEIEMKVETRVKVKGKLILIDTGSYEYQIWLSECDTFLKMLHWIKHLSMKTWMTSTMIERFIVLAATEEQLKEIHRRPI